jgi:hypothetical protein
VLCLFCTNQRRTPPAAQKLRRNRQRKERCKADDNFLITIPFSGSFPLLFTVWFAVTKEADFMPKDEQTGKGTSESGKTDAGRVGTPRAMTKLENGSSKTNGSGSMRNPSAYNARSIEESAFPVVSSYLFVSGMEIFASTWIML